jgi:oligoendopeptidase F
MNMTQTTLPTPFEAFEYRRPDLVSFASDFNTTLSAFSNASSPEQQKEYLNELNQLREYFSTMYNICMIRHTANTADPFYEAENQYFDESLPEFEALSTRFYEALLHSPFRSALEAAFGPQLFTLAGLAIKTFKPSARDNLQDENALIT